MKMQPARRRVALGLLAGAATFGARAQQGKPPPDAPPAGGRDEIVPLVRSFRGTIRKVQDIKPVAEVQVQGAAELAPLIDTFVGDLDIRYAFDSEQGFRYLNVQDLKRLKLARGELLALAVANFRRRYPKLAIERPVPFVGRIVNGGDLELSLMLDADFWEKEKSRPLYAGGELVVGVPVRDVLWFTGAKPLDNVRNLRENTERAHKDAGERGVSRLMYAWRNKRWEVFE
ncbi:MAG: hypothetical protein FJY56_16335 [Betaproteobacteria bacterium]|nr:hypothetical protein [Betaproteobacteria bacterium]